MRVNLYFAQCAVEITEKYFVKSTIVKTLLSRNFSKNLLIQRTVISTMQSKSSLPFYTYQFHFSPRDQRDSFRRQIPKIDN